MRFIRKFISILLLFVLTLSLTIPVFATAYTSNPNYAWGSHMRLQQIGSAGVQTRAIQRVLAQLNYVIAVDGSFGNITDTVVRAYQRANNLTIDGLVGTNTWNSLQSQLRFQWRDSHGYNQYSVGTSSNSSIWYAHFTDGRWTLRSSAGIWDWMN
jgi:peptidoglycan hydrolase-like protein with peptidoglycan-binding domain